MPQLRAKLQMPAAGAGLEKSVTGVMEAPSLLSETHKKSSEIALDDRGDTAFAIERSAPIVEPTMRMESAGEVVANRDASDTGELNPDGIRRYRLNLAREARKFKRFPELARRQGWEGEVSIVVTTIAGHVLPQVSLSQESGFPVLDAAALEMVRLAVPGAEVPESLRGQVFALTLPIRFSLED